MLKEKLRSMGLRIQECQMFERGFGIGALFCSISKHKGKSTKGWKEKQKKSLPIFKIKKW